MELDDIKASVRPTIRDEIDALHRTFLDSGGVDDVERFLNWLHTQGHISPTTFRQVHAGGRLQLTAFSTLAETCYPDDPDLNDGLDDFDHDADEEPTDEGRPPRFQFLGKLAAGAMGEIHIVRERELQRKVALKRMHTAIASKPKLVRRFLNEAQITAQLDHPNIVPVYSLDSDPTKPLSYTMKLIRGRTFEQLIHDSRIFYDAGLPLDDQHSLNTRLDHFVRSCDALSYAHSRGVVHRDLKPENIMVGEYGEVYVMDWGIARLMGSTEEDLLEEGIELGESTQQTRFGAVLGTPAFMSPEQARGENDKLDGRSDAFSLSLILYELVCLRPAVTGTDTVEILERMQNAEINPLTHHAKEKIAPELEAIVRRGTALRPDDRYQSVKELAEDVRAFLRGEPVAALPEGVVQRLFRWTAKHRRLVTTALMLAFVSAALVTVGSLTSTLLTVRSSSVREAQLAEIFSTVSRRGHVIDSRLQSYEGLLRVLAATTGEALDRDPRVRASPDGEGDPESAPAPFFLDQAPPDVAPAFGYGMPVSMASPVLSLPTSVAFDSVDLDAKRLAELQGPLRQMLSGSRDWGRAGMRKEGIERLLREEGAPVRWVRVGLESGLSLTYPGHGALPPGIDARREPWYESARDAPGPVWGNPHLERGGSETLFPISMRLVDSEGTFRGAVALDVGFGSTKDDLLALPQYPEITEATVLDEMGRVLLTTRTQVEKRSDSTLRTRALRRKKFDVAEVAEAVQRTDGGHLEVTTPEGGVELIVWSRMGDLGWTYLIRGPRDLLMR